MQVRIGGSSTERAESIVLQTAVVYGDTTRLHRTPDWICKFCTVLCGQSVTANQYLIYKYESDSSEKLPKIQLGCNEARFK